MWRKLLRFSLAEALVGMLFLLGLSGFNLIPYDEVYNSDPMPGMSDIWHWQRTSGFPFTYRKQETYAKGVDFGLSVLTADDFDKFTLLILSGSDEIPYGSMIVKAEVMHRLTPPSSFQKDTIKWNRIVGNLLVDLAVLFLLHVGYVLLWRERRNPGKTDAPQH